MKLAHAGRLAWDGTGKAHSCGRSYGKMQLEGLGKATAGVLDFCNPTVSGGEVI